ncbi:hypothetical protein E4U55_005525 [Claviceps digitariae]|nr:hypothetical protein E4U55_005525 [Claviceps digitariae]
MNFYSNSIYSSQVLVWVLWAVAGGMTAFRITFQWHVHRRLYAGDYFVIAGLISMTAMAGIITVIMPHAYLMAKYFADLSQDPFTPPPIPLDELNERSVVALKYTFSLLPLFWTTVWAAKFSVLFFIRLLLIGLPRYMMWWRICLGVVIILYVACLCSQYLTCLPLERNWSIVGCSRPDDFPREDGSMKFATAADITSDLLTMILPLNLLHNLTITKLQKLWLVTVFSLSGIIIAVALVRLFSVLDVTDNSKQDILGAVNMLLSRYMWSHIESAVALVVAALPALRFIGKKSMVKDKVPNSYGLVTIGGTGRSRPRPYQLDAGSEESVTRHGSQTDLEEAHGKSSYATSDPSLDRTPTGQSTRHGTDGDEESQSVRRCV